MLKQKGRIHSLRLLINRLRKRVYDTATNFKFVRVCFLLLIPGYVGLVILGVLVAYLYGGETLAPGEFFIWTNYISDLAGVDYSPAPYLYDIAAILCGILTIPPAFYLEKLLAPLPQRPEDYNKITRLRFRLASYGLVFSIIGGIGYIGIGIFSIDRNYLNIMHLVSGAFAFGGFMIGIFFYSLIILLYDTKIPKLVGIYGIIGPFSVVAIIIIIFLTFSYFFVIFEWILILSIMLWMVSVAIMVNFKEELQI